jgi:acyl-CoA thioester hydrolase
MYVSETKIRVHYGLTDQMGVVYHARYVEFYEIGRTEAIRQLGVSYKDIEASGIFLPVVDIHSKFLRPAKYDDLLTVKTFLKEMPLHHKVVFHTEIYNEQDKLLNTGAVTLYFMEARTMKRTEMPAILKENLQKYFQ